MSRSKSPIALAMAFALMGATPVFAWPQNGPEWLRMMEKIRADKADPGSPSLERANAGKAGPLTAHSRNLSRSPAIVRAR